MCVGGSGLCLPRRGSKTYFLGCPLNNSASVLPRLCVTLVGSWKSLVRMAWTRNSACPSRSFSSCTLASPVMCELIWFWWWWVLLPGVVAVKNALDSTTRVFTLRVPKGHPVYQFPSWILSRFLVPKKFFWFLGVFYWKVWVARKCSHFGGRL